VSELEVFNKTHRRNGGTGEFVSERAKRTVVGALCSCYLHHFNMQSVWRVWLLNRVLHPLHFSGGLQETYGRGW